MVKHRYSFKILGSIQEHIIYLKSNLLKIDLKIVIEKQKLYCKNIKKIISN